MTHHADYYRGHEGDLYVDHHDVVGRDFDENYRITPVYPGEHTTHGGYDHGFTHRVEHDDYHRGPHGDVYVDHQYDVSSDFGRDYQVSPMPAHTVIEPTIYGDEFDAHYDSHFHAPSLHADPHYYSHHGHRRYHDHSDSDHSDHDFSDTDSDASYAEYLHHKHGGHLRHHSYDVSRYHDSDSEELEFPHYHTLKHRYRRHDPRHDAEYDHLAELKLQAKLERRREKQRFKEMKEVAKLHDTFADDWRMSGHTPIMPTQTET